MVLKRPGGQLSFRPLHFYWICDASGSMSELGKMDSLNTAIRNALPEMRNVADTNPNARVFVQAMRFSHEPKWVLPEPVGLDHFEWEDLVADPLSKPAVDIVFLLDTSGSMSDEIESVKASCVDFADNIIKQGANVRLGLVGFDIGGHNPGGYFTRGGNQTPSEYAVRNLSRYTIGIWKLSSPDSFKKNIQSLTLGLFGGGGCYLANQDTTDIFPHVTKTFDGPSENSKVLVIISDEMGNTSGLSSIVTELKNSRVRAYVLGVPKKGGAHEQIATQTEGHFWDIQKTKGRNDFGSLLDIVSSTIAKEVSKILADGSTATGTDMGKALRALSGKLNMPPMPERALPPVIVLISDGKPTDDFDSGISAINEQPWGKKAVRLAIGIGKDADMNCLQKFIGNNEIKAFFAERAQDLVRYIKWVSTEAVKQASAPASSGSSSSSNAVIPELSDMPENESDLPDTTW